jgi:hypothetical protein
MSSKYRLTPKPGIIKAGRVVKTPARPTILPTSAPHIVKVTDKPPKIPPEQQPQKVLIQQKAGPKATPPQPAPRKRAQRPKAGARAQPSVYRSSPLRRKKDAEMGLYRKKVENLKDCGIGRYLVMVACGPSTLEVELEKLKGHNKIDLMSINKPEPRLHPTKYWVFCDQSQYMRNKNLFENYEGTIINAWSVRARHKNQILIKNRSGKGFSKNLLQGYYIGRSTTFANMQLALWMNYDKVFIFGCDMCQPPNAKSLHSYGTNPDVDPKIRVKRFQKEADHYEAGAKQMNPLERKKFVFCSAYNPWAFVNKFEKMDHRGAVEHILDLANEQK